MLRFDWNPDKAKSNFLLHKVTFETATRVFNDPAVLDIPDDREDYGEERWNALGEVDGRILIVTYTLRKAIWIISARRTEPHERRWYHEAKRC
jgi:uncharacterized DUF497 family protein